MGGAEESWLLEQEQLNAALEAALTATPPDDDVVNELLDLRKEKNFELTPRVELLFQVVALRDCFREGNFQEDDALEMCEGALNDVCAMTVPALDAETQLQLRKQHVLWPLRFWRHYFRKQPVYPELAERMEQVLLCEAPPTSCGCDRDLLRKMMLKEAVKILDSFGYSINPSNVEADVLESMMLLKNSTGVAIQLPSGPVRLGHMQIDKLLEDYPLKTTADCIQTCLENTREASQSQGPGALQVVRETREGEALAPTEVDEDAAWKSPDIDPTQRLVYPELVNGDQETPQQEVERETSHIENSMGRSSEKGMQMQQRVQNTGSLSAGASPLALCSMNQPLGPLESAAPVFVSPAFGVAAAAGAAAAVAAAGRITKGTDPYEFPGTPPTPPSQSRGQVPTSGQSLIPAGSHSNARGISKRSRTVEVEGTETVGHESNPVVASTGNGVVSADAPPPKTMKLKDFVELLKTADPNHIPFVPELVPDKWRTANMMALAAVRAARRMKEKQEHVGGSSEEEDALVAAPVIRQRQTAT